MLIAAIRSGGTFAGKAVSYNEDDGKLWLTGVGEITAARLLEYDAVDQVEWADDATRNWVAALAQDGVAPPPPAAGGSAATPAGGPSGAVARGDSELEPDDERALAAPSSSSRSSATPAAAEPVAAPGQQAPVAVPAALDLRRQRQPRPDFVAGKKERWRPSDLQKKTIAYAVLGVFVVAMVVLLGVWGAGRSGGGSGDQTTGWTAVVELSDSSSAQSESFELGNGQHRLEFSVERSASGTSSQYSFLVVPATAETADEQPFVVVSGSIASNLAVGAKTEAVEFTRPAGSYKLKVISENCQWSARVFDNM